MSDCATRQPGKQAMQLPERVLIIMPAYNEAENLQRVLAELAEVLPQADVVVIDDASQDETAVVAHRCGATVVSLPCNLGYGGAVQTGYRYAIAKGYAYAVMLDADGQHDPRSIPDLLAPVVAGEADVAVGSRFLGKLEYDVGWARRLGMRLFGRIVASVTGWTVTETTSGYQALNRRVLAYFSRDNYPSDYPDADTLLMMHFAGFCVVEVPVTMRGRIAGESMHASWKTIYYTLKMLLSIYMVCLRGRGRRQQAGADHA